MITEQIIPIFAPAYAVVPKYCVGIRFCVEGEPGSIAIHTVTGHTIMVATISFFGISAFWKSATAIG